MEIARVLEMMGCFVSQTSEHTTVEGPGSLAPLNVDLSGSPDGALVIAVTCLFADGSSRLRGLGSLRFKESDRLAATAHELIRLGAGARVEGDDLVIEPGPLRPARVDSHGDHRIAMSFAVAGLRIPGVEISDPGVVTKTWPGYWAMLTRIAAGKA
jgi:3-phosphoshikimate 1-carboxyvinyltransferase